MTSPFSTETTLFLKEWFNGGKEVKTLPYKVIKELENFRSIKKISQPVFRCSNTPLNVKPNIFTLTVFPEYTSWTYDLEVAKSTNKQIVTSYIPSEQFLIDTTLIPSETMSKYLGGVPEEQEIIVKPGVYFVMLVE